MKHQLTYGCIGATDRIHGFKEVDLFNTLPSTTPPPLELARRKLAELVASEPEYYDEHKGIIEQQIRDAEATVARLEDAAIRAI